jgi:hypothetical protein
MLASSTSPGKVTVIVTVASDASIATGTLYATSSAGHSAESFAGPLQGGSATFTVTLNLQLPTSIYAVVSSASGTAITNAVTLS